MGTKALSFSITLVMLVIAFMVGQHSMVNADDTDPVSVVCEPNDIGEDMDYKANVEAALSYLVERTPQVGLHKVQTSKPDGNPRVYARGSCYYKMHDEDCVSCLAAAKSIINGCAGKVGANVVLGGCSLR